MNFEEITNRVPVYRVNASTINNSLKSREQVMIGGEFKARCIDFCTNRVLLADTVTLVNYWFNLSDVSEVTPIKFNGKGVCIGDWVCNVHLGWIRVYGYHWYDGEWALDCVDDNNYNSGCYNNIHAKDLTDHSLTDPTIPKRTVEDILAGLSEEDKEILRSKLK